MTWLRQRRKPSPLEYNWTDRVDSMDTHLAFTARVHLIVHPAVEHRAGGGNDDWPVGEPPVVSQAAVWTRSLVGEATREWDVLHRHAAQHGVNERLSRHLPHTMDDAVVGSVTVALSVDEDDIRAAHELQRARREAQLDELACHQTATTLRFLREECFDNPGSARLFLMLNTNTRLGVFPSAQQADAVVDEVTRWHPDSLWVQVAKTLQAAFGSLTHNQTKELLRVLSAVLRGTGHPEQASDLDDLRSAVERGESEPA